MANIRCCNGFQSLEAGIAVRNHQTHYWALRQQARCSLATACGGRRVVALLWWWGVVFDLWIVVASIEMVACVKVCLPCGGGFLCAGCHFM